MPSSSLFSYILLTSSQISQEYQAEYSQQSSTMYTMGSKSLHPAFKPTLPSRTNIIFSFLYNISFISRYTYYNNEINKIHRFNNEYNNPH